MPKQIKLFWKPKKKDMYTRNQKAEKKNEKLKKKLKLKNYLNKIRNKNYILSKKIII